MQQQFGKSFFLKDGREVPENFNISSYTQTKMIKYPSRAKAGERLYLLHASEKKVYAPIFTIL